MGCIAYNLQVGPGETEWLVGWIAEHVCPVIHAKYVVDDDSIKQKPITLNAKIPITTFISTQNTIKITFCVYI